MEKRKFPVGTLVEIFMPHGRDPIQGEVTETDYSNDEDDYIAVSLGSSILDTVNAFWWDVRQQGDEIWPEEPKDPEPVEEDEEDDEEDEEEDEDEEDEERKRKAYKRIKETII